MEIPRCLSVLLFRGIARDEWFQKDSALQSCGYSYMYNQNNYLLAGQLVR